MAELTPEEAAANKIGDAAQKAAEAVGADKTLAKLARRAAKNGAGNPQLALIRTGALKALRGEHKSDPAYIAVSDQFNLVTNEEKEAAAAIAAAK